MAERSFAQEVQHLTLGDGDVFKGEGILAITKALLQSGVAYVGGYQGSPISHLMDVLADAEDILSELGVHFERSGSEATAAAMLSASINYPLRGAVAWKSTVGTNVASDALANLASSGVTGGAMVIVGEDYGEGSSIMQERTHAFAMKSQMWLLDPRPNLPHIVDMIEHGFALSEASNTPLFLMVRIRTCHATGEFMAKDNVPPDFNLQHSVTPSRKLDRIILPPQVFEQERDKLQRRLPAALAYIREHRLNEVFDGDLNDVGIILQGGLYNTTLRALERLGLADAFGNSKVPLYVMNVTYPLVPDELVQFCAGKQHVLMVEEGQPNYIEQELSLILRKADLQTKLYGKDILPTFGELTGQVAFESISAFIDQAQPQGLAHTPFGSRREQALLAALPREIAELLTPQVVPRPAGLCTGCPERPLFSAIKQIQQTQGSDFHISSDIGCHSFATLAPFNLGNTIMGYGFSLASSSAIRAKLPHRAVSIMGDGGFWHNGLSSGVSSAVFNKHDGVLIIVDNGYSAATGGQDIPSFVHPENLIATTREERVDNQPIEAAVRGVGVEWVRTVHTYEIAEMKKTIEDALTTDYAGLKVIIAEGECMLNKQRRVKPQLKQRIAAGRRTVKERFVVDSDTCTGDHSCVRISGCPSLTIKENPDPMRLDPVAYVDNSCVGCGVCGSNVHSAVLCPSFARAELLFNPNRWDKFLGDLRQSLIGFLHKRLQREQELLPPVTASIRIVVAALGGEGGGVLAKWIADMADREGYLSQTTSVPGVAQRTGATIYYIEIFPRAEVEVAGRLPVMSMFPTPGDVDIVICSEIVEAGRMIQRGFVTPDRTTLITSTHRVFSIVEKEAMANAIADKDAIIEVAKARAQSFVAFDMLETARRFDSVINAALFGALAECGALPFARESFEETVREGKIAVANNLQTFAASYDLARAQRSGAELVEPAQAALPEAFTLPAATNAVGQALLTRVSAYPAGAREMVYLGVKKLVHYQDAAYAHAYLDRLDTLSRFEHKGEVQLTVETARFLALWMAFEDLPRVAQIKIAPERFARFRDEVRAEPEQQVGMVEFLHPRVDEFCGIMPARLGRYMLQSPAWRRVLGLFARPRHLRTNSLHGFISLYLLAKLRRIRRWSLIYQLEQSHIEDWLGAVKTAAAEDYDLAVELARCGRLIKGYGSTRERGIGSMQAILNVCREVTPLAADAVRRLREAALADDKGDTLASTEREVLGREVPVPAAGVGAA